MAIDKELYERYKQLKAQGVNVTFAQLKSGEYDQINQTANINKQSPNVQNTVNTFNSSTTGYMEPKQISDYGGSSSQQSFYSNEQKPYSGNISQNMDVNNSSYMTQFDNTYKAPNIVPQNKYQGNVSQNSEQVQSVQGTKFGLLGYPLGHSLSAYIHKAGFKSLGLDYTYELLETPPENLVDRIKFLKSNNYAGFNVTIPLKLPIVMFLDEVDASADVIGAVNTVLIRPDKTIIGYNTDVIGFKNAIPNDVTLFGKTIGILGTGGAARAAITAFALSKVREIKIYTRNIPNSAELLNFVRQKFPNIVFNAYQIEYIRDLSDIDILVNCTPIGMQGRSADMTPVEEKELKTLPAGALVYDVIYNPKKTVLIRLAEKNGYKIITGMDMLIYQALEAEKIWTGRTPDFKDMKIAALENLD